MKGMATAYGIIFLYVLICFGCGYPEQNWRYAKEKVVYLGFSEEVLPFRHLEYRIVPGSNVEGEAGIGMEEANAPLLISVHTEEDDALMGIVEGRYDSAFSYLCSRLLKRSGTFFLRLNPKMEVPVHEHSWQYQSAKNYIAAFRHVSRFCKTRAPEIKIVWGPSGYPGMDEFWPGADVVDIISVSIFGETGMGLNAYPVYASTARDIRRRLIRTRFYNKPIMALASDTISSFHLSLDSALRSLEEDAAVIRETAVTGNPDELASFPKKRVGVYDPYVVLAGNEHVKVEHIFADWKTLKNGALRKEMNEAANRKHGVIITMEPWFGADEEKDRMILKKILAGKFDAEIGQLFSLMKEFTGTVYIRWAHEMEIPIQRYAWQSQDPVDYIKAYRYFMNFLPANTPHIKRVWGPAGDRGSMEFWPGADVVDYVSIAIYGLPDKNITDYRHQESFRKILERKLYRVLPAGKPVFITEFGVKGPEDFQKQWLEEAATTLNEFPVISGICYFNMTDVPGAWGDMDVPDWGIQPETFAAFVKKLKGSNLRDIN